MSIDALPALPLPPGVRSRVVANHNGLQMHVLEAGFESGPRPGLLLLHGFPELAYSWRKVMVPLAEAGWHVMAPDQRGYGRTTGWDADYDGDLASFRLLNLARDALGLVHAMGHRRVSVIGHDFGSPVAACCALTRPDVFERLVLMSAPFAGVHALPFNSANLPPSAPAPAHDLNADLAALPRPRKHYQWYYSTRGANDEMLHCPQGLHAFLRAYYHHKSADWPHNHPHPLQARTASELAQLPDYYIMDLDKGMSTTVAPQMPTAAQIAANTWLPDRELAVYAAEFARTGLQGGLQWYRCQTDGHKNGDLQLYAGRTIDVPSIFIAGRADWGPWQWPGAMQTMQNTVCTKLRGCHFVDGAGHWVQQEQPEEVTRLLLTFLRDEA